MSAASSAAHRTCGVAVSIPPEYNPHKLPVELIFQKAVLEFVLCSVVFLFCLSDISTFVMYTCVLTHLTLHNNAELRTNATVKAAIFEEVVRRGTEPVRVLQRPLNLWRQ